MPGTAVPAIHAFLAASKAWMAGGKPGHDERIAIPQRWTHPLARGLRLACAEAHFWDHLARRPGLPRLLVMPYLPESGAVVQAFAAALAQRMASVDR